MSIFNRLFGSKKIIDEPDENQHKQPGKPKQEIPENNIIQRPDPKPTNPPDKPKPEIKKKHKETYSKVTESNPEMPQSGIPWRTFPIFISSTFADMQAGRDNLKNVVFALVEEELQIQRIKLKIVELSYVIESH
jgi:hypothetical protein